MDGLSGVASAFAVVSLSIQLGDAIKKLRSLLRSIDEAPQDIRSIVEELNFLNQVLEGIKQNEQDFGCHTTTQMGLERCLETIDALNSMAGSFAEGFLSRNIIRRKWTALESVRKNDQIAKFKAKLHEAKLNLIMAQQSSAARTNYRYYQSHQESLAALTQCDGTARNAPVFQSRTVTSSYQQEESEILEELSSEIHHISGSWPVKSIQSRLHAELSKSINAAVLNVLQGKSSTSTVHYEPQSSNLEVARKNQRHQKEFNNLTITRTVFGNLRCSVTKYNVTHTESAMGETHDISDEEFEIQTSFTFVPSWWVSQFGMAALKLDVIKFSTQGWQTNLRTFNLISKDSPIFKFCSEGDVGAVRRLLDNHEASINDMTEDGMTPLHVAANRSQADICTLLLEAGADRNAKCFTTWRRTAFMCACWPGEVDSEGTHTSVPVPPKPFSNTIQKFVRTGEDFSDYEAGIIIYRMINVESHSGLSGVGSEAPSMWLLNDVFPTINPHTLDNKVWESFLNATLCFKPGDSSLVEIMEHCSLEAFRAGLMAWVSDYNAYSVVSDGSCRDFQLLADRSGGLNFLCPYRGKDLSLLSVAMEHSFTFSRFRAALERSTYEVIEVIRREIELYSDGWTVETLLSMFAGDLWPPRKFDFRCKFCQELVSPYYHDDYELPWERRKLRLKAGIDPEAPLGEIETRLQEEWDESLRGFEANICHSCQAKEKGSDLEENSPFLLAI